MHKKTQKDMAVLSGKTFYPSARSKLIKHKERDAIINDDREPLSYSVVTDQPQYREYVKKYPGEDDINSNMRNRRDYFFESFYNRYKKGFPQSKTEV
jgi:hypothetical protein